MNPFVSSEGNEVYREHVKLIEGTKNDSGKIPYDLLSPAFLEGVAKVLQFGAGKYEPYNWAKGIKYDRVFAALQRHLWAWQSGEELDEETGLNHLFHAGCCLMFLAHYTQFPKYKSFDNRPKYE